jgi:histidine triad (HIT) family protein
MSEAADCIFCKINSGEIPGDFLHRDEHCFVIGDIAPAAPTHLLVIPNEHLTHLEGLDQARAGLVGHMVMVAQQMAVKEGIADSGYRLVINQRDDAGQLIDHLHLHVLGGQKLGRMG